MSKSTSSQIVRALLMLAVFMLSSCLLPPDESKPKYLNETEFQELSALSSAKQLALSGRLESAELIYRKALKRSPSNIVALNDLGYLLSNTGRLDESHDVLMRAISIEPLFIPAKINLAKVFVELGEISPALKQYDEIEDIIFKTPKSVLSEIIGQGSFKINDIGSLNRLRASAMYLAGTFDDAVCESWLSQIRRGSIRSAHVHARLLLSLELLPQAHELLRSAVQVHQNNLPDDMVFDYGLVLIALQEFDTGKAVFDRVLSSENLDERRRFASRLIRNYLNEKEHLFSREFKSSTSKSFELDKVCSVEEFDIDGYWPHDALNIVTRAQQEVCSSESTA